ncbi:hypothetical protein XH98_37500 [Bradyrhizobium sp. CCBAU 51745]|nr:hypothetical protein [Bradyrhizobium sp. CCBAU 51745]
MAGCPSTRDTGIAMKRAVVFDSAVLVFVSGVALAQGEDHPTAQLRACSGMAGAQRLKCFDELSQAIRSAIPLGRNEDGWVVGQTRSPVDFSPIATATISSRQDVGSAMRLSIRCRAGRTELVVAGSDVSGRGEDYAISYRVNGGQVIQLPAAAPAFGGGVAFKTDAAALIQSLPSQGQLDVQLSRSTQAFLDASFFLTGLDRVRAKIAATCKWPQAIAKPNN